MAIRDDLLKHIGLSKPEQRPRTRRLESDTKTSRIAGWFDSRGPGHLTDKHHSRLQDVPAKKWIAEMKHQLRASVRQDRFQHPRMPGATLQFPIAAYIYTQLRGWIYLQVSHRIIVL